MITQKQAEKELKKIIKVLKFKYLEWKGKSFEKMKLASTTEKGDAGEDFLGKLLKIAGYTDVEIVEGRRGHYDVRVKKNGKQALFEVKTATLDTNNSFQFNGIRYDTDYTHLFCLGISPDEIGYLIVPKQDLIGSKYTLVAMAKRTNSGFKLTRPKGSLENFSSFEQDIKNSLS